MRTYLLPRTGSFFKSNLHCHSTVSDGKWTPEEIKERYMARGYSVVAYTDHSVFVPHNDLQDKHFLPLNGYEISFRESGESSLKRKCHICLISLNAEKKAQELICDDAHLKKNQGIVLTDEAGVLLTDRYDGKYITEVIRSAREKGFFVTYNHPVWSLETKDEFGHYHGMHAMEIVNWNCITEGYHDRNENVYDQMLRMGKRLYCVAADDNHDAYPIGHPKNDSFGGFTMIKAEELTYEAIATALLKGHFYASEGPEIKELYFENGEVHIACSEATKIVMSTEQRQYRVVTAETCGETITEAVFKITPKVGSYVRFSVFDETGKGAYSNAYDPSDFWSETEL